jgi:hypothetical protein
MSSLFIGPKTVLLKEEAKPPHRLSSYMLPKIFHRLGLVGGRRSIILSSKHVQMHGRLKISSKDAIVLAFIIDQCPHRIKTERDSCSICNSCRWTVRVLTETCKVPLPPPASFFFTHYMRMCSPSRGDLLSPSEYKMNLLSFLSVSVSLYTVDYTFPKECVRTS